MSVRNVTPVPPNVKTYKEKFTRKFKEQPLVPIGPSARLFSYWLTSPSPSRAISQRPASASFTTDY